MPRALPIFALLLVAAVLRFHDLSGRVMHTDEAVHGVTVGRLLEGEAFRYDPRDFHGPTLHYSTIPVALARGQSHFQDLDETTLRGVTAGYGLVLVLMTFCFRRELGLPAVWFAAWLTAISPIMVFFSRYYIMELPFAVFLALLGLACWRFAGARHSRERLAWAVTAGVAAGLLHATKETFVIHVAAMAMAAVLADGRRSLSAVPGFLKSHGKWLLLAVVLAFLVSAALLSHGFQRPEAILDGMRTYLLYLQRAEGSDAGHAQPWYGYFAVLFFLKPVDGFWYSEIGILVLGLIGAARAVFRPSPDAGTRVFTRALAIYTVATMVAYSLIPYKTPWSFLATMHGLILLSGYALAGFLPARATRPLPRPALGRAAAGAMLLALVTTHALLYVRQIVAIAPADSRQPMVYGHTEQDFLALVREIDRLETLERRPLTLLVAEDENGWPLPWYRRHRLGSNRYGRTLPDLTDPPDIVVVSTDHFADAAQALFATHLSKTYPLRPELKVHAFFRRSLTGFESPARPELAPSKP